MGLAVLLRFEEELVTLPDLGAASSGTEKAGAGWRDRFAPSQRSCAPLLILSSGLQLPRVNLRVLVLQLLGTMCGCSESPHGKTKGWSSWDAFSLGVAHCRVFIWRKHLST